MKEFRCSGKHKDRDCNKLLFRLNGFYEPTPVGKETVVMNHNHGEVEIKCSKCKTLNTFSEAQLAL